MLHLRSLLLVVLISTRIPLSTSYSLAEGGELMGGNVRASDGPYDIALDEHRTAHPSVTNSVEFPLSFSVSSTSSTCDKWSLGIEVTLDVPVPSDEDKEQVTQITVFTLQGPDSVVEAINKTSGLCAAIFAGVSGDATTAAQNADLNGDCTRSLSGECRQELAGAALDEYHRSGQCGISSMPNSCKAYFPVDF